MRRKRRPFQIGSVIKGRYEIVRKVGQGGFGIVYKARERTLKRFVAIKALREQRANSLDVRQRFVNEARKLAKVDSQHVVKVHNTGTREGVPYFVMEFVPFSVDELIHEDYGGGPVDYGVATSILKQTLAGLSKIHRRKWTHRDIKPENILLTASIRLTWRSSLIAGRLACSCRVSPKGRLIARRMRERCCGNGRGSRSKSRRKSHGHRYETTLWSGT